MTDIWSGIFQDFSEAAQFIERSGRKCGLDEERWTERITSQLLSYRNELATHKTALPPRPSNLPLVVSLTKAKTILDFGGSSGWCFDYLSNSCKNYPIELYGILESDFVVNFMRTGGFNLHRSPVKYFYSREFAGLIDLLYVNSVLQYFPDNEVFISLIKNTCPKFILLDDLVSIEGNSFITTQNYYDCGIPYRFIDAEELQAAMFNLGYVNIFRLPYMAPIRGKMEPFKMDNFPVHMRLKYASSVFYARDGDL